MREVFRLIEQVATSQVNVLIEGESGTGKELVARAIHALGGRGEHPFFAVNCATFKGNHLLSELFGHERGAVLGPHDGRRGKLELAAHGTVLLDEVGEIPLEHQGLLLRVLESRVFERVGGAEPVRQEARILAATHRPLRQAVEEGAFRSDLYYRLEIVPIRLPPLRERVEDIPLLLDGLLARASNAGRRPPRTCSPEVIATLEAYPWPGNVRELRNLVEYLCFACEEGEVGVAHLPASILDWSKRPVSPTPRARADAVSTPSSRVRRSADDDERARIERALAAARWKKAKAAADLGIDRTTLWRKMKRLGID